MRSHTYTHTYIYTYIHTHIHTYIHTYLLTYLVTYLLTQKQKNKKKRGQGGAAGRRARPFSKKRNAPVRGASPAAGARGRMRLEMGQRGGGECEGGGSVTGSPPRRPHRPEVPFPARQRGPVCSIELCSKFCRRPEGLQPTRKQKKVNFI